MDLFQKFQAFIRIQKLLQPEERVLVAVSGGADSVVLAQLFRRREQPFGIAHCNFCLRGAESDGDESFVRALAAKWGVPVFVQHFDTKKYAAENGLSTQMAARELRYQWFDVIRESEEFARIATGHHLNDSVETALLHFIRGTGLSGLGGIPMQNGPLVRPLLFATRDEIEDYAREQALSWREDSTNALDDYSRNAIRHHILPNMQKLNASFFASAAETLLHLRAADENLQHLLGKIMGPPDAEGIYHLKKQSLELLPARSDALFDLLQPYGFTAEQVRQIIGCWDQTGTEWYTNSGCRLVSNRDELLLTNKDLYTASVLVGADDLMVRASNGGRLVILPDPTDKTFPEGPNTIIVDAEKLRFPLHLRHWAPGDHFQPFGMDGQSQKLQDFFTNQKVSRLDKDRIWILENGDRTIIWVVGMRLDERYKVRSESKKLLKICWIH